MNEVISNICEEIRNHLIAFKRSDERFLDIKVLKKIIGDRKITFPINDIRISPEYYGWSNKDECPSLDWFSFAILYYLSGNELVFRFFLLMLRTINYHGFLGLIVIFDKDPLKNFSFEKNEDPTLLYFSYYQYIAKYYRALGNVEKAQYHYLNLLEIAKDTGAKAFIFSLLSKLNTDYLLRKGMAKEYSRISFKLAIKSKEFKERHTRRYIICLDTYAKDIYLDNPKKAEKLYSELLELGRDHPLSLIRIEFRVLEARINHKIKKKVIQDIPDLLKEYDNKINLLLDKMPKAKYIRTLHFVGFFREIIVMGPIKDDWFNKKYKTLLEGEAEYLITSCIDEAKSFRDRRFIALGYYELSFWYVRNNKIDEAISLLVKGLGAFDIDKKSIINVIYTEILKALTNLYGRKLQWEQSLQYHNELYEYFQIITTELEKQKKNLENYLPNFKRQANTDKSEFSFLEAKERENMYQSLLIDYDTLVKSLLEYGTNINKIQAIDLHDIKEAIRKQNHFISHEIRKHYNNLDAIEKDFRVIICESKGENKLRRHVDCLEREIASLGYHIDGYEKTMGISLLKKINISEVADSYIETFSKSYAADVVIRNLTKGEFVVKFNPFDIKEYISILLSNAYKVGQRHNINPIVIEFELFEDEGVIFLQCSDNCGEYPNFKNNIVDNLNSKVPVTNCYNKGGHGFGLQLLKDLSKSYNIDLNWNLKGNDNLKILTIPLAYIGE